MAETTVSRDRLYEAADRLAAREDSEWPRPRRMRTDPARGTVAIVGKGPTHVLTPYGAEGYEFWGLNDQPSHSQYAPIQSYTRWFQLHPPHYLSVHYPKGVLDLDVWWGDPTGVTLYMDRHYSEYPDSTPYPKMEVEALVTHGEYHVSSFDWMVALAVLEGWSRIELYGCEFYTFPATLNGEPVSARPCLEYWIGVAEGAGADVTVFQTGDLFKNLHVAMYRSDLQYGFEREPALDLTLTDSSWSDVR